MVSWSLSMGTSPEGSKGLRGPCPEGNSTRGDTDQSSLQEGPCQTHGMKRSGVHGNLKGFQGLKEVRGGRNSGTGLPDLVLTNTDRVLVEKHENIKPPRDDSAN